MEIKSATELEKKINAPFIQIIYIWWRGAAAGDNTLWRRVLGNAGLGLPRD
jgi:hypothetical protein